VTSVLMNKLGRDEIESLVREAKNLDREALSELCVYFYPRIYRYVFYRVGTRQDAEDITSEVFVRMVKSLNTQKGSFQAWLFRIASNLVIDHYRRNARQKKALLNEESQVSLESTRDESEDLFLQHELKTALAELTEEQQQVITLKFMEGYDNSEIADILSKSVGAVKALQFRALASLREILKRGD
jgi:RNA polymerase sigma-70 factor (ECF subfamily)